MKTRLHILGLLLGLLLFGSCGEPTKNTNKEASATTAVTTAAQSSSSADYSALLTAFSCDIDVSDIAKATGIPISNIKRTSSQEQAKKVFGSDFPFGNKEGSDNECLFELSGFGIDKLGNAMVIEFRVSDLGKATIKKAIKEHLEHKEEGIEKITQRFIIEADTKDNYITTQPRYGRVSIYNENYDGAFIISYGSGNANNDRTKEQQEILGQKMVRLANHLLKEYRK